mmetsp:Transcript_48978/g.73091  ORF Transcript_48978/g.73091 Transcript_48978/m.73091 type:complete len:203 (-) Transcript_48978:428-1036(-)
MNDNEEDNDGPTPVPFSLQPSHFFIIASLPTLGGAWYGYQKQLKVARKEAQQAAAAGVEASMVPGDKLLAFRALAIGSMLSVGVVTFFGAVTFYACGFRSLEDASKKLRRWGKSQRERLEAWSGKQLEMNLKDNHPDRVALANATEEEELQYLQDKYLQNVTDKPDSNNVFRWSWNKATTDESKRNNSPAVDETSGPAEPGL